MNGEYVLCGLEKVSDFLCASRIGSGKPLNLVQSKW